MQQGTRLSPTRDCEKDTWVFFRGSAATKSSGDFPPSINSIVEQQVARNIAYLTELAGKHAGETVVVVTHGGVLSGLFRHTFSIPFAAPRRFDFTNAGLNVFNYEDGNWFLQTWGDVSHLAPEGRSDGEDP